MIRATEQGGEIPGLVSRMPAGVGGGFNHHLIGTQANNRASLSYVTGAHNLKVGYQGGFNNPSQTYQLLQRGHRCPVQQRRAEPAHAGHSPMSPARIKFTRNLLPTSFYGQDQWTRDRLTLQGGVRYDHYSINYPESTIGGPGYTAAAAGNRLSRAVDAGDRLERHHAAAWAWPTTCSATARPRVKFNLGKYMAGHHGDQYRPAT